MENLFYVVGFYGFVLIYYQYVIGNICYDVYVVGDKNYVY